MRYKGLIKNVGKYQKENEKLAEIPRNEVELALLLIGAIELAHFL